MQAAPPVNTAAEGDPAGRYRFAQAYALLAFLVVTMICLELARLSLVVLVDPVKASFGISDLQVSFLLGALSSVPFVAMSIVGGYLSDRLSRKMLLGVAIILWSTGAMMCAAASDFSMLAAGRVLVGLGAGMKLPIAMTWVNDAFPPARRGRAIGAFFVVLGIGPSLAIMLAGAVQGAFQTGILAGIAIPFAAGEPWRSTIALLTLPSVAALLLLPFLADIRVREPSEYGPVERTGQRENVGLMMLVVLAAAFIALVDSGSLAWISTIFMREFGYTPSKAGFVLGLASMVAGLAGPLAGGALGDLMFRRGGARARIMLAAGAAGMIAPLSACYLFRLPAILIPALTLAGMCTVAALSLSYVAVQAVLPPRERGLGTGIMSAATTLIGSFGPTLVALTSVRIGGGDGALIEAGVLVAGAAALAAASLYLVCALRLRGPQPATASAV